ncbi:MAG: apolipoprotein N-acyltransferase [Gemmatimonadota bacterium]|nr:apolipoprotein N-acyltransferase [Gemmatimonadota bacterium]
MVITSGVIPGRGLPLLPVVSALLLVSAFPPLHLLIPSFVALVPLAVWISDLGAGADARRSAFGGGVWFGLFYFGLLLHWIPIALMSITWWALPLYLGGVMVLAFGAGAFAWAFHGMTYENQIPLWVALPLAWTALECLRANAPGELAFPWLGLGTSLTGYPELVGSAELVGTRGITFWLALVNGLLAEAVLAGRTPGGARRILRWVTTAALVISFPAGWGYYRVGTLPLRAIGEIAVVQPNVSEKGLNSEDRVDSALASLARLVPKLAGHSPELVVWPEVTFSRSLELDEEHRRRVESETELWPAPVLFGAVGRSLQAGTESLKFNSAFLAANGRVLPDFRYDKHRLVPLVERVPFVPERWLSEDDEFGHYERGRAWPLGKIAEGAQFGVLICYESTYPSHARRFRIEGADFLVNITNDAWFGREPWYSRTGALWQHPAHLVMRAIENRVGIARAANTGISLFVDPLGRTYGEIGFLRADVQSQVIYTSDIKTLYTQVGDVAGSVALILTIALVTSARLRPKIA